MPLATAPCPKCRTLLVYGQRQCMRCQERFDYGASPPPEPSADQIREALAHTQAALQAQQQAAQVPPVPQAPPVAQASADLIDRGRYDDALATPVQTEAIPGFIDSTLFAAFTPKEVAVERLADLESTQVADEGAPVPAEPAGLELELTSYGEVGEVQGEAIPGFIDSTLFKAFTPDHVETETPEGLEVLPTAFAARASRASVPAGEDGLVACRDCGTPHDRAVCPACGARRGDD